MKKFLALLATVSLAAQFVPPVAAQTNQTTTTTNQDLKTRAIAFVQGASAMKTLTFGLYPSYAPDLVTNGKKDQFGFGVFALYPLGDYAYTGLRIDQLGGSFWAPSASVGLKADVQVFGMNFTPMTYTGVIIPLSGAGDKNGSVGAIAGGGVTANLWRGELFGKPASFSLGAAAEKWSNFPGMVYHIAPILKVSW